MEGNGREEGLATGHGRTTAGMARRKGRSEGKGLGSRYIDLDKDPWVKRVRDRSLGEIYNQRVVSTQHVLAAVSVVIPKGLTAKGNR